MLVYFRHIWLSLLLFPFAKITLFNSDTGTLYFIFLFYFFNVKQTYTIIIKKNTKLIKKTIIFLNIINS